MSSDAIAAYYYSPTAAAMGGITKLVVSRCKYNDLYSYTELVRPA